jgi:uncharacterized repeat protein (TIGR01451 family)
MRHVTRGGSGQRREHTRIAALAATCFLLMAGTVVSMPGLTASAGSATSTTTGDDSTYGGDNHDGGDHGDDECVTDETPDDGVQAEAVIATDGQTDGDTKDGGDNGGGDNGGGDNGGGGGGGDSKDHSGSKHGHHHHHHHHDTTDCDATLTVDKVPDNQHGGNLTPADFQLLVDGVAQDQNVATVVTPDVAHVISEVPLPGYVLRGIICTDVDSDTVVSEDGTVTLEQGQDVSCEVTNDDIAPTLTVHKIVDNSAGGTALATDFVLTLNGQPVPQGVATDALMANAASTVSENDTVPGYAPTSVVCVSDVANSANTKTALGTATIDITPALAENIDCTITNHFVPTLPPPPPPPPPTPSPPTITVVKAVSNNWGGPLLASDFQLKIDGVIATQNEAHVVAAGPHSISEVARAGYFQTSIACVDNATHAPVGGASVTLVEDENVTCTVSNSDLAPTLTLTKQLIIDNGGVASPGDFQLQIDGAVVPQNQAQAVQLGSHTVGEVPVVGWSLLAIRCTDNDTHSPVVYDATAGGITLALGQHATCVVFNDDEPLDLSIAKSVDAGPHVAGGAPFDYTITVDNVGPRDVDVSEVVTVTDQLPAGLSFVGFPANCDATGQTLTCIIDPALLHVADPAVVLTVTVRAAADTPAGTYTNLAYVDTPNDSACGGNGCVPVCAASLIANVIANNNVACANTTIALQAGVKIDKVDNVDAPVNPGATYSYFITVSNPGPSTFIGNLAITDDLPDELHLVSVTAAAPWSCVTADPVVCTYDGSLQPGPGAPVITITVTVDSSYLGDAVQNQARATAFVDPPTPPPPNDGTEVTTGPPGTKVTATDSETTPVVRTATTPPAVASSPPVPASEVSAAEPQLPRTGNGSLGGPLDLATWLLGGGLLSLVISRRRRGSLT